MNEEPKPTDIADVDKIEPEFQDGAESSDQMAADSMNNGDNLSSDARSSRASTRNTGDDSEGGLSRDYHDEALRRRDGQRTRPEDINERDENGALVLSQAWLTNLFRTEWRTHYVAPELNERLYLHNHGFRRI